MVTFVDAPAHLGGRLVIRRPSSRLSTNQSDPTARKGPGAHRGPRDQPYTYVIRRMGSGRSSNEHRSLLFFFSPSPSRAERIEKEAGGDTSGGGGREDSVQSVSGVTKAGTSGNAVPGDKQARQRGGGG